MPLHGQRKNRSRTQNLRKRHIDHAKIEVIEQLPPPTNIKVIRSFLGHAGFYRRFIKNFSHIAWPLTNLLAKDAPFVFDEECLEAFHTLKKALPQSFSHPTGTYHLKSCVMQATSLLEQYWQNTHWPTTKLLNHLERTISSGLCNRQVQIILGRIESHHLHRSCSSQIPPNQERCKTMINSVEFDIEIRDKEGVENSVADHLSRMKFEETSPLPIDDYMRDDQLQKVTTTQPWYVNLVNYIVAGYVPEGADKGKLAHDSRFYLWDDPYLYKLCTDSYIAAFQLVKHCKSSIDAMHPPMEVTMGLIGLMQKFSKVGSTGLLCTGMQKSSCDGVQGASAKGI
ncbi:LOW QUALITY PROTEIN: hypothetical protein U9M48_019233 [Paspalum notatum var. saurae]|uniref:Mitochondrial protein n=1 Tax=Paspalum notatum var. saurae TaxID=547442 RepID=A0AAQ3TF83_PASNO